MSNFSMKSKKKRIRKQHAYIVLVIVIGLAVAMDITFMLHFHRFQKNALETFHKFIIQSNIIYEAHIPKKKNQNLRARAATSASKNRTEQSGSIKICKMQIVQSIQIDHN